MMTDPVIKTDLTTQTPTLEGWAGTPGPYRIHPDGNCDIQTADGVFEIATTHPEVLIRGEKPSGIVPKHNARLLAASYDLALFVQKVRVAGDRLRAFIASAGQVQKERDDWMRKADRWLYHAQSAKEDVLRLLRIDEETEYGQTTQKNVDAREAIRQRYASGGEEFRAPMLEIDTLRSRNDRLEGALRPFAEGVEALSECPDDDAVVVPEFIPGSDLVVCTVGDLRAARKALEAGG